MSQWFFMILGLLMVLFGFLVFMGLFIKLVIHTLVKIEKYFGWD